jgi:hypothetical protein
MHHTRSIRLLFVLIGILFITTSCTKQEEQPPLVVEEVAAATDYTRLSLQLYRYRPGLA